MASTPHVSRLPLLAKIEIDYSFRNRLSVLHTMVCSAKMLYEACAMCDAPLQIGSSVFVRIKTWRLGG